MGLPFHVPSHPEAGLSVSNTLLPHLSNIIHCISLMQLPITLISSLCPSPLGEKALGTKTAPHTFFTLINTESSALQPLALVIVALYQVLTVGPAVTVGQVVQFNPSLGDHK